MNDSQPWLSLPLWRPPNVRHIGEDAKMLEMLRAWTRGVPLRSGLMSPANPGDAEGHVHIHYGDEHRATWAVSARQRTTGREVAVYGYSSLVTALEDCLDMARDYEAEDALFVSVPGCA